MGLLHIFEHWPNERWDVSLKPRRELFHNTASNTHRGLAKKKKKKKTTFDWTRVAFTTRSHLGLEQGWEIDGGASRNTCRAAPVSPSLTYKSCWRLNLGWGSARLMMGFRNGSLLPLLLSALTPVPPPPSPPSVRQRLRAAAVLNIEDSHWGHLIQGPSLSLSSADLDCLLHTRHVYCGKQASEMQQTGNSMALLKQWQIRF